jgi:hypothetical protein
VARPPRQQAQPTRRSSGRPTRLGAWLWDVDPHFAGIGGSRAAIDELLADQRVDVVEADPRAEQPSYW